MIGQEVSHYRVLQELGGGGMGVVFRAEDTRLGRQVALKFLPVELSNSAEALARFQREARLASSLNHPHICTVHDIGQYGRRPYIVMELLEGQTLRQLIERESIPIERILTLAEQIGEALEAAHRRGIIHRDIKPANVFVTSRGDAKVLDFGLAKLGQELTATTATGAIADLDVGGVDEELTNPGIRVGTMAYMSPEQARGEPLDIRTDIFSFGAMLYEMATGRRAFPGDGTALVLYQILHATPIPPGALNPGVPPALEQIIRKAMEKDRDARYHDAGEMLQDIRALRRELDADRSTSIGRIPVDLQDAELPGVRPPHGRRAWIAAAAVMVVAVAAAVGYGYFWRARPAALGERDSILMAGFANQTGDPVFDETLGQALSVQLSQSPFLNMVPEERVTETLQLMGRTAGQPLTHAVARDVCQRLGVKAMLEGSIARLGSLYVVGVEATNCATDESLARQQEQAASKEQVLHVIGEMSSAIRARLGESLPTLRKFDVPIEQATTPSLEALKSYTLAVAQRRRGAELESIPLFLRAVELDPNFASAYTMLSTVYGGLGEEGRSEEYARLAYERRGQVSERERLFITHQYHDRVTGDQFQSAEALDVWKVLYPRDFRPANALAVIYNRLGFYDRAVKEAREALVRYPDHAFALSNLSYAYRGLGNFDEAKKVANRAVSVGVATVPTRRLLFQNAEMEGDTAAAQAQMASVKGTLREFDFLGAEAQVVAFEGRMREARALYRRVIALAERQGLAEVASGYQAQLAWTEALYGFTHEATEAQERIRERAGGAQALAHGPLPRFRAVASMALTGARRDAETIVESALKRYPASTMNAAVLAPVTRALIDLKQKRFGEALTALKAAEPYEFGNVAAAVPVYVRAEVLAAQSAGAAAAAEFQRLIDRRGVDPFATTYVLAYLGLARAQALAGATDESRAAYQRLFDFWSHADADLPPLVQAKDEYAKLQSANRMH
jgi:tetratricopeptide (TPR) repeat protein